MYSHAFKSPLVCGCAARAPTDAAAALPLCVGRASLFRPVAPVRHQTTVLCTLIGSFQKEPPPSLALRATPSLSTERRIWRPPRSLKWLCPPFFSIRFLQLPIQLGSSTRLADFSSFDAVWLYRTRMDLIICYLASKCCPARKGFALLPQLLCFILLDFRYLGTGYSNRFLREVVVICRFLDLLRFFLLCTSSQPDWVSRFFQGNNRIESSIILASSLAPGISRRLENSTPQPSHNQLLTYRVLLSFAAPPPH